MSSDRLHAPLSSTRSEPSPLVEARFIPRQYEPNYPYPLLVQFHSRGGDEEQLVRAMPALSWRNYVGQGLRGPEPVIKRDRLVGYGWGAEFEQPGRRRQLSATAGSPFGNRQHIGRQIQELLLVGKLINYACRHERERGRLAMFDLAFRQGDQLAIPRGVSEHDVFRVLLSHQPSEGLPSLGDDRDALVAFADRLRRLKN